MREGKKERVWIQLQEESYWNRKPIAQNPKASKPRCVGCNNGAPDNYVFFFIFLKIRFVFFPPLPFCLPNYIYKNHKKNLTIKEALSIGYRFPLEDGWIKLNTDGTWMLESLTGLARRGALA